MDKTGDSEEGKEGVGGVRFVEEASGEGAGVGVLDLSNSGGMDSKGLGGPDGDMVNRGERVRGRDTRQGIKAACEHNPLLLVSQRLSTAP